MVHFREQLDKKSVQTYDKLIDKAKKSSLLSKIQLCEFIVQKRYSNEQLLNWTSTNFNDEIKKEHDMISYETFVVGTTPELAAVVQELLLKHNNTPQYLVDDIVPAFKKDALATVRIIKRITRTNSENLLKYKDYEKMIRNEIIENVIQRKLNKKEITKIKCGVLMIKIGRKSNFEVDLNEFLEGSKQSFRNLSCEKIVEAFEKYQSTGAYLTTRKEI